MIFLRVKTGVTQHFHIRLSEWLMLVPSFGMWMAFTIQHDMFETSGSYMYLSSWGDEHVWASIFLIYGIVRASALVVNGTFELFPYSPHIRMLAAVFGALFWSQFSLGFLKAYLAGPGALSPVVAYTTLTIFELANVYRASKDVGFTYHEIKKRQRNEHNGVGI